jgi:tetratricopeptide (TPR) repeat protein/tRNA A-37 threonylcarbamoyl transferase component Bud32
MPALETMAARTSLTAAVTGGSFSPAAARPAGGAPPAPHALGSADETGLLAPGQTFGARYHIIRLLGRGGMGAVYHAWDAELGVSVAIKVILPAIMANPETGAEVERRFKRELLLARQVTHKNVVRIHDLGEIDGIKYITMSYVEGIDLATRLKSGAPVPMIEIMRVARAVVSGLVAAHTAGVVHRDLKPANIMLAADGEALIMDFGIARSSGPSSAAAAETSVVASLPANLRAAAAAETGTVVGAVTGTVGYMAPEQARGLDVDQRADVYAFGLILYDLLIGRRRQHDDGPVAELQARMEAPPPSTRTIVGSIPEAFDAIVMRCLEPDQEKRFQTTRELESALNTLDDRGEPIPVRRVFGVPLLAAVVGIAAIGLGASWYYASTLAPPVVHEPVSVVIADLDNQTGDPAFDGTLEPTLKRALEGAGFISAFDRNGVLRTVGATLTGPFDAPAARAIAVKQGLGVVMSGSVRRQGSGYLVSIKTVQSVTGEVIADDSARASSRDEVLSAATGLIGGVREALGDESDSAQMFAKTDLSATSLDVVRLYAAAQDAMSNSQFDQAVQHASQAVALDPKFGIGYQLLSVAARNMGRLQDADRYINEALRHLDGMTERERLITRGMFYRVSGDHQQCVKEYGELIARYAADVVGHNQLALCYSHLRDMRRAVSEMGVVVRMLPNRALFRFNLAIYSNYATDFDAAEREMSAIKEPDVFSLLALAFAQAGQGQIAKARLTYARMANMNARGKSAAISGLADLAMVEGRYADAVQLIGPGVEADIETKNPDRAAMKLALLASAQMLRKQPGAAIVATDRALSLSKAAKIRFLAGRTFIEAGQIAKARPLIDSLALDVQTEPQTYAKILEAEIALSGGNSREAIKILTEANAMLDTWIGTFDLGLAYFNAKAFPQADSQFDRCLKRRGEAMSLFLDEEPTFGVLPPVYYYQGRVREAMQNDGFAESYRAYLALRGASTEDRLARELRRDAPK